MVPSRVMNFNSRVYFCKQFWFPWELGPRDERLNFLLRNILLWKLSGFCSSLIICQNTFLQIWWFSFTYIVAPRLPGSQNEYWTPRNIGTEMWHARSCKCECKDSLLMVNGAWKLLGSSDGSYAERNLSCPITICTETLKLNILCNFLCSYIISFYLRPQQLTEIRYKKR